MAKATPFLIQAIRNTATTLAANPKYQWGHMGSCNCGHLAQEITQLQASEIHQRAMQKYGDWNEQLNDYCPTSGLLMDDLITQMLNAGLDTDDLKHLEKLSDQKILRRIPIQERDLRHNRKADVVKYLNVWAQVLSEEWAEKQPVPAVSLEKAEA